MATTAENNFNTLLTSLNRVMTLGQATPAELLAPCVLADMLITQEILNGTATGEVFASANNAFTGNNTYSGTTGLNGIVTATAAYNTNSKYTTTEATDAIASTTPASIKTAGGVAVAKAIFAGTTINAGTNLTAGNNATAGGNLYVGTALTYDPTLALVDITGNLTTSGNVCLLRGVAATMTTGYYLACYDGAVYSLAVGANGHLHSNQTTAPTAATNATGISAIAITAGSTDTCGKFTTTGTPQSGTVLTITFNKTYTVAPKFVSIVPLNAAGGEPNTIPYVSSTTATTFVLTYPAGGVYAATPSYSYLVVA